MSKLIDAHDLWSDIMMLPHNGDMISSEEVEQAIKDAPTVDAVEVVHGRWKDGECTICGFDIRDMIDGESEFRSWVWDGLPYCPYCGAMMDGG